LERQAVFAKQEINRTAQSGRGAGHVPGHDLYSVIPGLKPVTFPLKFVPLFAMTTFGQNRIGYNQFPANAKKPFVKSRNSGN
jgi:flavodoxin